MKPLERVAARRHGRHRVPASAWASRRSAACSPRSAIRPRPRTIEAAWQRGDPILRHAPAIRVGAVRTPSGRGPARPHRLHAVHQGRATAGAGRRRPRRNAGRRAPATCRSSTSPPRVCARRTGKPGPARPGPGRHAASARPRRAFRAGRSRGAVPALVELRREGRVGAVSAGMNQAAMLADLRRAPAISTVCCWPAGTRCSTSPALADLLPVCAKRGRLGDRRRGLQLGRAGRPAAGRHLRLPPGDPRSWRGPWRWRPCATATGCRYGPRRCSSRWPSGGGVS